MKEEQIKKVMNELCENSDMFSRLEEHIGDWIIKNPRKAIRFFVERLREREGGGFDCCLLRLVSEHSQLVIPECSSNELFVYLGSIFSAVSPEFANADVNLRGIVTPKTSVQVFEIMQNATCGEVFGAFSKDLDALCFTQEQIMSFVVHFGDWIKKSCGGRAFFLSKSCSGFFVAYVYVYRKNEWGVQFFSLESDYNWKIGAPDTAGVIIPKKV
ncbi:MAG: hypothetical protein ABFQ53_03915 [Patescibacteria group bacterium]